MSILDYMGREMDYARISVTDRCNYRCVYCMPEEGVTPRSHADIMRYEEIVWLVRALVSLGVRRVRFTGGEPFARRGMAEFLVDFRREFPDLCVYVTTNASLLPPLAPLLERARLSGMNVSLDTLDPARFAGITRVGDVSDVTRGIDSALDIGVPEMKTNTVLMRGFNDAELPRILSYAWDRGMVPRIIEFMPLEAELWGREKFVGSDEIFDMVSGLGDWRPLSRDGPSPRGPAKYYSDAQSGRVLGIIEAISNHFCADCNRIRITASGGMRACLFNNAETPMIELIRARDEDGVRRAILSGINLKPESWRDCADGRGRMSGIGG
jgi:cyclic pyranopterin phosphate synthase